MKFLIFFLILVKTAILNSSSIEETEKQLIKSNLSNIINIIEKKENFNVDTEIDPSKIDINQLTDMAKKNIGLQKSLDNAINIINIELKQSIISHNKLLSINEEIHNLEKNKYEVKYSSFLEKSSSVKLFTSDILQKLELSMNMIVEKLSVENNKIEQLVE